MKIAKYVSLNKQLKSNNILIDYVSITNMLKDEKYLANNLIIDAILENDCLKKR